MIVYHPHTAPDDMVPSLVDGLLRLLRAFDAEALQHPIALVVTPETHTRLLLLATPENASWLGLGYNRDLYLLGVRIDQGTIDGPGR